MVQEHDDDDIFNLNSHGSLNTTTLCTPNIDLLRTHFKSGGFKSVPVVENLEAVDFTSSGQTRIGLDNGRNDIYWDMDARRRRLRILEKEFKCFRQPLLKDDELNVKDIPVGPEFHNLLGSDEDKRIQIDGGDGTHPMIRSFAECEFHPTLRANMAMKNIQQPTLIQKYVMPIILWRPDYDLMARAETGSGKTAAFVFPIIHHIFEMKRRAAVDPQSQINVGYGRGPFAMIISPTRELAQQLGDTLRAYAKEMFLDIVTTYGATSFLDAIRSLRIGCDILVGTPGRIMQFLRDGHLVLKELRYLVLDEGDKLLQDNFAGDIQTLKIIITDTNGNFSCRIYMFSATFSDDVKQLASTLLKANFFRASVGPENAIADTVRQDFIQTAGNEKLDILLRILLLTSTGCRVDENDLAWQNVEKVIIFCNTRRRTNWLALQLSMHGIKAISTNGDRTQQQRQDARDSFERGDCDVLVSTNVFARGLNIAGVQHIINYEMPTDGEDYVHRIGRTGRAGNVGRATSFVDMRNVDDQRLVAHLAKYLHSKNQPIPSFMQVFVGSD